MTNRLQPSETSPWSPEPVASPAYWAKRLAEADGEVRRAVFNGSIGQLHVWNDRHREVLAREIRPADVILDAGCGYGRIYDLLPRSWRGRYNGIDVSPELIREARRRHHARRRDLHSPAFVAWDLRTPMPWLKGPAFDLAIACGLQGMVTKNLGAEEWGKIEAELRRVAKRLLVLPLGEPD